MNKFMHVTKDTQQKAIIQVNGLPSKSATGLALALAQLAFSLSENFDKQINSNENIFSEADLTYFCFPFSTNKGCVVVDEKHFFHLLNEDDAISDIAVTEFSAQATVEKAFSIMKGLSDYPLYMLFKVKDQNPDVAQIIHILYEQVKANTDIQPDLDFVCRHFVAAS